MSRPSKQKQHCKKAGKKSSEARRSMFLRGIRAALAAIACGLTFTSYCIITFFNANKPVSRYFFDAGMKFLTNILLDEAKASAAKYFEAMEVGANLSFDASWSHRRNAKLCVGDFIDIAQKKIVAFSFRNKLSGDEYNNYKGPSNMMEASVFEDLIPFLKNSEKIHSIIKDGDTKIEKLIKKYNWTVNVISDINHKYKNFHTSFHKINKRYNSTLRGIEKPLKDFLGYVLFSNYTKEEKLAMWRNVVNHFTGDHSHCIHDKMTKSYKILQQPKAVAALKEVVAEWSVIVENFIRGQTTNYNENYHSIKAQLLNKNFYYGKSSVARLCASILQYNEGFTWIENVIKRINHSILPVDSLVGLLTFLKKRDFERERNRIRRNKNPEKEKLKKEKARKEKQLEITNNPLAHH